MYFVIPALDTQRYERRSSLLAIFTLNTRVSFQCLTLGFNGIDCTLCNIFGKVAKKLGYSVTRWNDTTYYSNYLQIAMFVH
ncbi:hypothetical protein [Wolbachia endosymbiont of Mansonella ozzardi]|uniref:hypothetical protein n=1 Tax=Wolbachia endosymbiont of Mansonella ozzardi TaxID=137464 RepID=UPI001CE11056|nr:hypothetical protein [Wolbachia endosymbiont of Mansonella ozzardi]